MIFNKIYDALENFSSEEIKIPEREWKNLFF